VRVEDGGCCWAVAPKELAKREAAAAAWDGGCCWAVAPKELAKREAAAAVRGVAEGRRRRRAWAADVRGGRG